MPIVLTMLCGDIPWAPGGLLRCIDIISEPGSINNCTFPAGICKGSVGFLGVGHAERGIGVRCPAARHRTLSTASP